MIAPIIIITMIADTHIPTINDNFEEDEGG